MIHIVTVRPTTANIEKALRDASNGFYVLSVGVYLMVTEVRPPSLTVLLRALGAIDVLVICCQRDWASYGDSELLQWLCSASAADLF